MNIAKHNFESLIDGITVQETQSCDNQETEQPKIALKYRSGITPETRQMAQETINFIKGITDRKPKRWLTLTGNSGVGKTHLAKEVKRLLSILKPNEYVRFIAVPNMLSKMRSGDWEIIERMIDLPFVLILDDLGAENQTKAAQEALYRLLTGREGKWTMITSNLSIQDVASVIDPRIASRLVRNGSKVIEVRNTPDFYLSQIK